MSFKFTDKRFDGVSETIEYDESEDRFTFKSTQDVRPILDHMNDRSNDGTRGFSPSGDLRLLASVPEVVYDAWLREAMKKNIPLFDKQERDRFIKRKLAEMSRLKLEGSTAHRVGYQPRKYGPPRGH